WSPPRATYPRDSLSDTTAAWSVLTRAAVSDRLSRWGEVDRAKRGRVRGRKPAVGSIPPHPTPLPDGESENAAARSAHGLIARERASIHGGAGAFVIRAVAIGDDLCF